MKYYRIDAEPAESASPDRPPDVETIYLFLNKDAADEAFHKFMDTNKNGYWRYCFLSEGEVGTNGEIDLYTDGDEVKRFRFRDGVWIEFHVPDAWDE